MCRTCTFLVNSGFWCEFRGFSSGRQKELFALGATKTMNSRPLTGHAIDVMWPMVLEVKEGDWPLYEKINQVFQELLKYLTSL